MNFLSPCWFGHGDRFRERDEAGNLELVCQRCGHAIPVLASEVLKGPKFHQVETLGTPKTTTAKATPFQRRKIR